MKDPVLKKLVYVLGYLEGLPVVTDPKILDPEKFLTEVLTERVTNPFLPDTPQRIATDTSQKLAVRFGETLKTYGERKDSELKNLTAIPLVIAGWFRYLLGTDDRGYAFELSPDPMLDYLRKHMETVKTGGI